MKKWKRRKDHLFLPIFSLSAKHWVAWWLIWQVASLSLIFCRLLKCLDLDSIRFLKKIRSKQIQPDLLFLSSRANLWLVQNQAKSSKLTIFVPSQSTFCRWGKSLRMTFRLPVSWQVLEDYSTSSRQLNNHALNFIYVVINIKKLKMPPAIFKNIP